MATNIAEIQVSKYLSLKHNRSFQAIVFVPGVVKYRFLAIYPMINRLTPFSTLA